MAVILKALNNHLTVSIKKTKEGGYAGGRATFGYTKQKGEKELKIHNGHAEEVKRLFELKQLHRKWSLSRLAEALNDEGYPLC